MAHILEEVMKHYKEPMTRENFLKLKHGGKVPSQMAPEDEEDTPARFQQAYPTHEEKQAEEDKKNEGKDAAKESKPKPVPPPVYKPSRPLAQVDPVYDNPHNTNPSPQSDTEGMYMPDVSMNRAPAMIARPEEGEDPNYSRLTQSLMDTSNGQPTLLHKENGNSIVPPQEQEN